MNPILVYCHRDLRRWIRGKWGFIAAMVMPAAWLIFVGLALPIRFTDNYIDFVTPGILVMTILSASLAGGGLLIMDRMLGFFNKFLALPPPRETILFGKILVITIRGIIQSTIILLFAFMLGAHLYTPVQLLGTYIILCIFGALLSAAATSIAIYLDDHDQYAAANAMISMPLFFTSSAMMPYDVMPEWLAPIARLNPLSYAIDGIRILQTGEVPVTQISLLSILCVIVVGLAVHAFRKVKI
ncbi:ABC transporter permease [Methanospirillum sp. J.3.6.1-F.2.7.3]|uniref:ABC transporter permease n=1 Tax=Methanospirillum purgamenti TaxID=2834276 RepID=A0A8E7AWY9_9EURY|nr:MULTISPECIES: ABC transporter permease [Methanospirillum]MDX8550549.1 ABC transporter permease [Methanospirillum hungatei]NLW76225.1 ABC transporter permease [Methanomicrobiales archaeon]QVV88285.1 ABC transporter permease [Methanospirillum sp. J.3.6.1-F.2.7.3]